MLIVTTCIVYAVHLHNYFTHLSLQMDYKRLRLLAAAFQLDLDALMLRSYPLHEILRVTVKCLATVHASKRLTWWVLLDVFCF